MLKKTITYEDYNGESRTEDFFFNFSKAELAEMELEVAGGLSAICERIVNTKDTPALIKIFKKLVLDAYGIKSDDGRRFIKSAQISKEFSETEAYSQIFMELATNSDAASEFINQVIPASLVKQMEEMSKQNPKTAQ